NAKSDEIIIDRRLDAIGGRPGTVIDLHPHAEPDTLGRCDLLGMDPESHLQLETVKDRRINRARHRASGSRVENITSRERVRNRWPLSTNRFCPVTPSA